ncbi:hypothetical protein H634G_05048 [Metarhizium anisopliae BRIP 53293]|uniref:Uncharacterized protein n=1 Tax=Metarhizium anisopliae BRIP 53293 TaxID=1291518 RepID=A0A0D9NZI2_METAN|nr:hypothetical protein H634G_05048 [Metarhizium anisopliae BRIP 53293]KJK89461.1 hypothetical protein H633G_06710 [Metarhizium anisopliae BRIP 53284]
MRRGAQSRRGERIVIVRLAGVQKVIEPRQNATHVTERAKDYRQDLYRESLANHHRGPREQDSAGQKRQRKNTEEKAEADKPPKPKKNTREYFEKIIEAEMTRDESDAEE